MKKLLLASLCAVLLFACGKHKDHEDLTVSSLEILNMSPKDNSVIAPYFDIMASLKYNIPVDILENYGFYVALVIYSTDDFGTTVYERKIKDTRNGTIDMIHEMKFGNYEALPETMNFRFILYRKDKESFGTTPLSSVDFSYQTGN